jgi:hypothetical protein
MPDKRVEILNSEYNKWVAEKGIRSIYPEFPEKYKEAAINAMDENGKLMCLDLLQYMAENGYECAIVNKEPVFLRKLRVGWETLNKEQLFKNFL